MSGLQKLAKQKILDATTSAPSKGDFVWDGKNEDERPLTKQEMQSSIKRAGRPKTENPKKVITIRISPEVDEYFRTTGKGWQTRIDEVLREYIASTGDKPQ